MATPSGIWDIQGRSDGRKELENYIRYCQRPGLEVVYIIPIYIFLARTTYMAPPKGKGEEGGKISSTCLLRDNDYTALPLTERERASHTPKFLNRDMDCWVITLQSLNSARFMKLSSPFSRCSFYYTGPFSLDYFSNVY